MTTCLENLVGPCFRHHLAVLFGQVDQKLRLVRSCLHYPSHPERLGHLLILDLPLIPLVRCPQEHPV